MSKPQGTSSQASASQASSSKVLSHSESKLEVAPNFDFRSLFQFTLPFKLLSEDHRKLCYLLDRDDKDDKFVSEFLETRKNFQVPENHYTQQEFSEQDVADRIRKALEEKSLPKLKVAVLVADTSTKKEGQRIGDFDFLEEFSKALSNREYDIANLLLDAGLDHTVINKDGDNALIIASSHRFKDLASQVIKRAEEMGQRYSPQDLGEALASASDKTIASKLLEAGADPTVRNKHGNNALINTSVFGWKDLVPEILQRAEEIGKSYSAQDLGEALMRTRDKTIVSALLEAGADPTVRNKHGENALIHGSYLGCEDLVPQILQKAKALGKPYSTQDLDEALARAYNETIASMLHKAKTELEKNIASSPSTTAATSSATNVATSSNQNKTVVVTT